MAQTLRRLVVSGLGALLLAGCGSGAAVPPAPPLGPAAASGLVWADEAVELPGPVEVVVPPVRSAGTAQTIIVTIGRPAS